VDYFIKFVGASQTDPTGAPNAAWGDWCPSKRAKDLTLGNFFYFDAGMTMAMHGVTPEDYVARFTAWKLVAQDKLIHTNDVLFVSDVAIFTITTSGWYTFSTSLILDGSKGKKSTTVQRNRNGKIKGVRDDADVFITDVNFGANATGVMLTTFSTIPNLQEKVTTIQSYRLDGVYMWTANNSPEIQKQGSIVAALIPSGLNWWEYTDFARIGELGREVLNSDYLPAQDGLVGFVPPSNVTDLDLATSFDVQSGVIWDSYVQIWPDSLVTVINIDAGTDVSGHNFTSRDDYKVRYYTDDPWATLAKSNVPISIAESAIRAVSNVPFMRSNTTHVQTLLKDVNDAVNTAMNVVGLFSMFA